MEKIMEKIDFKKNFKLYLKTFGYVKPYKKLIIIAAFLSVFLSVTSGFATYSFLPVFNIVFQQNTVVQEAPAAQSAIQGIQNLTGKISEEFNLFFRKIAGQGSLMSRLVKLVIFIVLLSLVSSLLMLLVDFIFVRIQADSTKKLREDSFSHISELPLSYFNKIKSGTLISRLENDIGGATYMVSRSIFDFLLNFSMAFVFFVMLVLLNLKLALTALPIIVILALLAAIVGKWIRDSRKKILELQADISAFIQEFLTGIKTIKGFSTEEIEKNKWEEGVGSWRDQEIKNNIVKAFPMRLTDVFIVIFTGIVLIFGGKLIVSGTSSVSELLLFFVILLRFQTPVSALSKVWFDIQNGMAYAERTFGLLDLPEGSQGGVSKIFDIESEIAFKNVYLDYGEGEVLKNINLVLPLGKMTALVGSSGSGKTSLADLLIRFYNPTEGEIILNGKNIDDFDIKEYRSLFGLVTQETFLFHDTIFNNIIYGLNKEVVKEEVFSAARAANAHDFISEFPQKYDTIIGDRGVRLSGGERQRIALTRAILRNPKILILDEATSSLDTKSERQVQEAIDNLIKNRTTLIIAHRLSTIQRADKIVVLHEGKIVEQGNHEELLEKNGFYRHLWNLQINNV